MITPNNTIPPDDADDSASDDQQSQKDIHSNGFDEEPRNGNDNASEADRLQQASAASEAAYTLNTDDEPREKE